MKIWLFAAFLILWGNLLHPLIGASAVLPGGSWQFVVAGAVLVVISLAVAGVLRLQAESLGLRRAGALRGAAIGAIVGGLIAAAGVAVLRFVVPAIFGQPIVYEPLSRVAPGDLTPHIAFFLPFGAVIPEEVAFRGTLLGGLLARYGVRFAVTASATTFALWHGTVAVFTVMNTTMPVVLIIPAIAGALVILFLGGAIVASLRVATGTLLASIAAHWAFNAIILVGLRYPRID
ncbi:MAG TPA: type II CAAX endopeptidase family protein [Candidatus Limnocylindria bacterium]|nr:type II CAAX endopeptidase family protein [Candidatus Limnocylindria bacterium]